MKNKEEIIEAGDLVRVMKGRYNGVEFKVHFIDKSSGLIYPLSGKDISFLPADVILVTKGEIESGDGVRCIKVTAKEKKAGFKVGLPFNIGYIHNNRVYADIQWDIQGGMAMKNLKIECKRNCKPLLEPIEGIYYAAYIRREGGKWTYTSFFDKEKEFVESQLKRKEGEFESKIVEIALPA